MIDLVNITVGNAGITAILGYLVVFFGLVLLMLVVMGMSKLFIANEKKAAVAAAPAAPAATPAEVKKPEAPGTAGELKLYNTEPKDAAMIMAIVADTLGKPINQLRFISIKEVKK